MRSLVIWSTFFFFIFWLALVAPLWPLFKRKERTFQELLKSASVLALSLAGIRIEVAGLNNLSKDQGYIIAVNHSSFLDNLVLLAKLPISFKFVADEAGFSLPLMGRIYRSAGYIKTGLRMHLKDTYTLYRALRQRESVLVYSLVPERGEMGKFSSALPAFAREAGVPILPVCLKGCSQVLPMNKFILREGRISLRIGESLPSPDPELLAARMRELYEI